LLETQPFCLELSSLFSQAVAVAVEKAAVAVAVALGQR
jgi:hypothetical protein